MTVAEPVKYTLAVRCDGCGKTAKWISAEPYIDFRDDGWTIIFNGDVCSRECAYRLGRKRVDHAFRFRKD